MKTHLVAFDVHIPNKDQTAIEKIIRIDVPVQRDEILNEDLMTEEGMHMIDAVKIAHGLIPRNKENFTNTH